MVKFKSRYLLVEVLYEDKRLHRFDSGKFANVIKVEVENNFGEVGLGKICKNLQIKYANNYTNMLIIRVSKEHIKLLRATLALINKIDCDKVRLRILSISGTIKSAEKRATKFLEDFLDINENLHKKDAKNVDVEKAVKKIKINEED